MAGGATIDHIIAVTILLTAMLLAMMTFNGLFAQALDYDTNRQVANKAVDIMNTICLSPGSPTDWGETDAEVLGFGLQDPDANGYALSPYSVMRLRTSASDSQLVYYPGTGLYYNNVTSSSGYAMLTPIGDCINYTEAADLLGLTGEYGFNIDIAPTLEVEVTQVSTKPLVLNVKIEGSGLPLTGATLDYHLLEVDKGSTYPLLNRHSGEEVSGPSGSVDITFPLVTDNQPAYTFTVYVNLGGISGVGHYTYNTASGDVSYITPLIQDYDNGTVLIAHSWDIFNDPGIQAEVKFNATFYILTSDFSLQPYSIVNSTDHLNWGSNDYFVTQVPASETGFLVISYLKSAVELGTIIMPWGTSSIGVASTFSSGIGSEGYNFVATELRQVTIDGISYQVTVSVWKLGDY